MHGVGDVGGCDEVARGEKCEIRREVGVMVLRLNFQA